MTIIPDLQRVLERILQTKKKKNYRELFILIKGTLHPEDIIILSICAQSTGSPSYIKQMLLDAKSQINTRTIIVSDFKSHCHK